MAAYQYQPIVGGPRVLRFRSSLRILSIHSVMGAYVPILIMPRGSCECLRLDPSIMVSLSRSLSVMMFQTNNYESSGVLELDTASLPFNENSLSNLLSPIPFTRFSHKSRSVRGPRWRVAGRSRVCSRCFCFVLLISGAFPTKKGQSHFCECHHRS